MSKFSYVHCLSAESFDYVTINDLIQKNAENDPDKDIFIFRKSNGFRQTLSYQKLLSSAHRVAKYLISLNVNRQDRIGLYGPNSLNRIIAEVGILLAGATVLQLNIEVHDVFDANSILDMSDCRVIFLDPGENGAYEYLKESLDSVVSTKDPSHRKRNFIYLRSLINRPLVCTLEKVISDTLPDAVTLPEVYPEDDAVIFITSGSTGKPKKVVHGHFNFVCMLKSYFAMGSNAVIVQNEYNDRPFALFGGNPLMAAILGAPRVFTESSVGSKGTTISEMWKIMKEENIKNAHLMPHCLFDLINEGGNFGSDEFRLKSIRTGGQVIDEYYTQVLGQYCDELNIFYGSTEAGAITVRQPLKIGDVLDAGDVGVPVPGVEIRIMGTEQRPLHVGELGEIQVRSHYLMKRYDMVEGSIGAVFTKDTPAWFSTGDIGLITDDGNLIVHGRFKDNISRGGRKISPGVIDRIIKQLIGISQVVTIAVPDSRLYEEICVCYTTIDGTNPTPETVKFYCERKFIKDSVGDGLGLMPKYFLMFKDFPIMSAGKINKQGIIIEAKRRLALE